MKRIILVFALAILAIQVYSQGKNWKEGKIILVTNDTVSGKIKLPPFSDLRDIGFIGSDKEKREFTAEEINGFIYEGEEYVSVPVDSLEYIDDFTNGKRVFLKVLEKGAVNLYVIEYCFEPEGYSKKHEKRKPVCPAMYYTSMDNRKSFFLAYKDLKKLLMTVKQPHSHSEIAYYFKDNKDLSDKILYEVYKPKKIHGIVRIYNKWAAGQNDTVEEEK